MVGHALLWPSSNMRVCIPLVVLLALCAVGSATAQDQGPSKFNPGEVIGADGPIQFTLPPGVQLGPPLPPREIKFVKLWASYDFAMAALQDIQTVPAEDQPYQRYVATQDTSDDTYDAFCWGLNLVMQHNSTLYRPARVASKHLIRVDLRQLASQSERLKKLGASWEKLSARDPHFHTRVIDKVPRTITRDIPVPPYRARDGRTYSHKTIEDVVFEEKLTARPSQHAGLPALEALHLATSSESPLISLPQLVRTMLSQLGDGMYYEFRGIEQTDSKSTAEQKFLDLVGADQSRTRELRAEERVAMWRSGVTGNVRAIEFFYATGTRARLGPSLVTITRDFREGKVAGKRNPIKNLLNYTYDGSEAIAILPCGLPAFVLTDGTDKRVDVGPQDLVTDHRIPAPHPANLQPGISCIRCHAEDEGWKPARNDVYLAMKAGLTFLDDESSDTDPVDTRNKLDSMFRGEIDEPLRVARTTTARATFLVAGGKDPKTVATKLSQLYDNHTYGPVTAQVALRDMGYEVAEADAIELFNRVVPALPANRFGVPGEGITSGSLRLAVPPTAKGGKPVLLSITRDEWDQEFQNVMLRVVTEELRTQKSHPAMNAIPVKPVEALPK